MTVFLTEKTLSGVLSALFSAFTLKKFPDSVKETDYPLRTVEDEYITVKSDAAKSERVLKAVTEYGGERTVNAVKVCLYSCDENALKLCFDFLRLTLATRKCQIENLSEKAVTDFLFAVKRVLYEKHRFTGFLRFKETASGTLYAAYSPDNDITGLLMPHFTSRLSLRPFVIHDVKRNVIGISDGKTFRTVKTQVAANLYLSEEESAYAELFRTYFNAVNVKERKNLKQQDNFLPRRYRKFLPETYE